jgi:hypothetical protein
MCVSVDRYTIYLYHDTDDEIPLSSRCSEEARDVFCHGQRRSQTGRLDSKQIHESRDSMNFRTLHEKIGGRAARCLKLRPYARVPWFQGMVR